MSTITITTTKTEPTTIPPTRSPAEHLLASMRSMLESNPHDQIFDLIHLLSTCESIDPAGVGPDDEVTPEQAARAAHNATILGDHIARAFLAMGEDEAGELALYVRDRLWENYELRCEQNEADYLQARHDDSVRRVKQEAEVREARAAGKMIFTAQEPNIPSSDKRLWIARQGERAMRLDIADLEAAFRITQPPEPALPPVAVAASVKAELDASTDGLDRWDAAGRTLAELDPEAFRAALALVQTMATKAGAS